MFEKGRSLHMTRRQGLLSIEEDFGCGCSTALVAAIGCISMFAYQGHRQNRLFGSSALEGYGFR